MVVISYSILKTSVLTEIWLHMADLKLLT